MSGTNGIQLQSVGNTEPAFHSENQVSPGMYIHLVIYFSIKIYGIMMTIAVVRGTIHYPTIQCGDDSRMGLPGC